MLKVIFGKYLCFPIGQSHLDQVRIEYNFTKASMHTCNSISLIIDQWCLQWYASQNWFNWIAVHASNYVSH